MPQGFAHVLETAGENGTGNVVVIALPIDIIACSNIAGYPDYGLQLSTNRTDIELRWHQTGARSGCETPVAESTGTTAHLLTYASALTINYSTGSTANRNHHCSGITQRRRDQHFKSHDSLAAGR